MLVGKDVNTIDAKSKKAACLASLSWRLATLTTSADDRVSRSALLPVLKREDVTATALDGDKKTALKCLILNFEGQALGISYATENMIVGIFGFSLLTKRKKASKKPESVGSGHRNGYGDGHGFGHGYATAAGETSDMGGAAIDAYGFGRDETAPDSSSEEEDETSFGPAMQEALKHLTETTILIANYLHDELASFHMPERYE